MNFTNVCETAFENLKSQDLKNGLYLVSMPIGNMADITFRAIYTLFASSVILCEDTRVTSKFLLYYGIEGKKLVRYDDYLSDGKSFEELKNICSAGVVSLVSDAGTPVISDPGFKIVKFLRDCGVGVYSVIGACSLIAAMSLSGEDGSEFGFIGFFDKKKASKVFELSLKNIIFFDNPTSLKSSIKYIAEKATIGGYVGTINVQVFREVTKKFESIISGSIEYVSDYLSKNDLKGEVVVIVTKNVTGIDSDDVFTNKLDDVLKQNTFLLKLSVSEIVDFCVKFYPEIKLSKKQIYSRVINVIKNDN